MGRAWRSWSVGLCLVVVGVTGCGGGHGGSSAGANAIGGSSPSAPGRAPSRAAAPSAAASTAVAGGQAPESPPVSATAAPAAPAARSRAGSGAASPFARPGTYHYSVSDHETSAFGTMNVSGTDAYTVYPATGGEQRSVRSGKDGKQDVTLKASGANFLITDIVVSNPGFSAEFKPQPPALYFAGGQAPGYSWRWSARSTDGKYTIAVRSTLGSAQSVLVGGQSVTARVVSSILQVTGPSLTLTVNQKDWVSTAYRLVLREIADGKGHAYGTNFTSTVTSTLASTTPS